jgi:hypothetical protein
MKNLSRNKEIPMDRPFRKMSVTHDMSKSEREINKQKVLEAKAMNEQDKAFFVAATSAIDSSMP